MKDDMTIVEQSVWCHLFIGRCSTADSAVLAECVADEAIEVLRRRGLIYRADKVISERVMIAGTDSIPVCLRDR